MGDASRDGVGPDDRRARSAGIMAAIVLLSIVTATRSNGQDAPPIPGRSTADLFRKGAAGFPAEAPPAPSPPWHDPSKPLPEPPPLPPETPPSEFLIPPTLSFEDDPPKFPPLLTERELATRTPFEAMASARRAFESGDWRKGLEETTDAIRLDPGMVEAYRLRASFFHSMRLFRRAIADLTRAIEEADGDPRDHLFRGWAYCKDRDFSRGLADIDRGLALSKGPSARSLALQYRGAALALRGDDRGAIEAYDDAERLGPLPPFSLTARGYCCARSGNHDRAIGDYDRSIALAPSAPSWYFRGESHLAQGTYPLAQADYEQAISSDPGYSWYYQGRGWALLAQGQVAALDDFTRAIGINPQNPRAYTGRAWAYLARRDVEKAIADFDKAIALQQPGRIVIDAGISRDVPLGSKFDRAVAEFNERCRAFPSLPFALMVLQGEESGNEEMPYLYWAACLVCRHRADPGIAPSMVFRIEANWRSVPEAKSAYAGRAIAAMLRSDWPEALHHLDVALGSLIESRDPGSTRPSFPKFL